MRQLDRVAARGRRRPAFWLPTWCCGPRRDAAVAAGDVDRRRHRPVHRVMRRLEAEDEQRRARRRPPRSSPPRARSSRRQFAGSRPDWESSRTAAAAWPKSLNSTPQETLKRGRSRTRIQASVITPRIPSEPTSIRSGDGPGARTPGSRRLLPLAARRDRADRFDQVVDVGVDGGEVAAGAGRDPAAERRVLKRLRVVAQRQAVLLSCSSSRGPGRAAPRSARRGRPGRPRARGRAREVERDAGRSRRTRLDAADDAGAAAEGDDRRPLLLCTRRARPRRRPRTRRIGDEVGRVRGTRRGSRGRRRGRPCRARGRRGRAGRR